MKKTIFFCILYSVTRIIIVGLIAACLGFSICVFNSMKNYEITVNETTTHIVKCNKNDAPRYDKVVQKQVNWYPVFSMTYFVVLAGTLAALIVLFAKDDSWLKCAKLDELHEIKEKLLEGEVNDSANKTEIEDKSAQKTTNMGKDSNTNTKITETTKTNKTTEITDQRAMLLKHYMSCVADI